VKAKENAINLLWFLFWLKLRLIFGILLLSAFLSYWLKFRALFCCSGSTACQLSVLGCEDCTYWASRDACLCLRTMEQNRFQVNTSQCATEESLRVNGLQTTKNMYNTDVCTHKLALKWARHSHTVCDNSRGSAFWPWNLDKVKGGTSNLMGRAVLSYSLRQWSG
jgi:hypothetical protein